MIRGLHIKTHRLVEGFVKYTTEMKSVYVYISNFMKVFLGI
jgi:hypothetical protein